MSVLEEFVQSQDMFLPSSATYFKLDATGCVRGTPSFPPVDVKGNKELAESEGGRLIPFQDGIDFETQYFPVGEVAEPRPSAIKQTNIEVSASDRALTFDVPEGTEVTMVPRQWVDADSGRFEFVPMTEGEYRFRVEPPRPYQTQELVITVVGTVFSADDVWIEKDRRLALGFTYDFGNGRGEHHIGTTSSDLVGWDEVAKWADTKLKLEQPDASTAILTNSGVAIIKPMEWYYIQDAAATYRQRVWAKSFALAQMSPIPTDYAADKWW